MQSARFIWILLLLALFTAFFEIGRRDVVEDNEGQRATPPAEMLRTGSFLIPTLNGKDYLAKPPLLYWAIAGVYAATGTISPVTARIPTALCFVILVLCIYGFTRREAGEMAARWSALAVMISPYVVDRARYAELDVPLTLATFLAILGFRAACCAQSRQRTAAFAGLSGLTFGAAILLKGPVPFLFLCAAWLAQLIVTGNLGRSAWKTLLKWTVAAFAVALTLWLVGFAAPRWARMVRFPVALVIMMAAWILLAWRHGGVPRRRYLILFLTVTALGILVAAPWGASVLIRKGWPFVSHLIHSEVLERTHTASRINSGSPFYYLIGLVGMLAPWGLLLPCHGSKKHWEQGGAGYRFTLVTGWLSVLVFSLIAGKEYEYILPAAPFLLIVVGSQLADMASGATEDWSARWMRIWRDLVPGLLILIAIGLVVLIVQRNRPLVVHAVGLTAVLAALAWYGHRHVAQRLACVFGVALCVVMLWVLSQDYRYTGKRSFKTIATVTADLLRNGYEIEAVKMTSAFDVYPGFAFYAGRNVLTVPDIDAVRPKLKGNTPYFCVLREEEWRQIPALAANLATPLLGPYTTKKIILVGNRPLPVPIPQ